MTRHSLDASKLSDFTPRKREHQSEELERWTSREGVTAPLLDKKPVEGQFNIRAPLETINRFKRMCKDDRRTYADMLEILMNSFEGK